MKIADSDIKANSDGTLIVKYKDDTFSIDANGKIKAVLGWIDNGNKTYTKVKVTVKVGDYVGYDCYTGVDSKKLKYESSISQNGDSNQMFEVHEDDKNMKWKFLVINDGNLVIVAAKSIDTQLTLTGNMIYPNGSDELKK